MARRVKSKNQFEKWIKEIDIRKEAVGVERDKIDDLLCELSELKECCDEAYYALEQARDALSRLV